MKYSHVYPASVHELPGAKIYMIDLGDRDALVCEGKDYFPQEMNELTHETANRLRALFPFTAPVPAPWAWATGSALPARGTFACLKNTTPCPCSRSSRFAN